MFDQILSWMLIFLPVAFGFILILVPAKQENEKQHMRWRYILGGLLIIFGGLAWLQQSRAAKASAKDREQAIQQTAQTVAATTSASVSKTVTELYSGMVSDQKAQIAQLQSQLAAQGKDVSVIKGSDIVTGKNPLKVEVTNALPATGPNPQETEVEKKRKADVRTKLGIFLGEATAIKDFCLGDSPPPQFSCVDSANDWARRTLIYIGQNLEQSYQPRFLAATGFSLNYNAAKTQEINGAVNYQTFKASILEQFIKEFRD